MNIKFTNALYKNKSPHHTSEFLNLKYTNRLKVSMFHNNSIPVANLKRLFLFCSRDVSDFKISYYKFTINSFIIFPHAH